MFVYYAIQHRLIEWNIVKYIHTTLVVLRWVYFLSDINHSLILKHRTVEPSLRGHTKCPLK